jgi:putative flippase GtrA
VPSQFVRFVGTGVVNTAVGYAIYVALLTFLPYLVAYAIAYVIGIAFSYFMMTRFVFDTPRRWSTALQFPAVYVVQYLMNSAVIYVLVEYFRVPPFAAALVAIVLSVPVTFVLARTILRKPR